MLGFIAECRVDGYVVAWFKNRSFHDVAGHFMKWLYFGVAQILELVKFSSCGGPFLEMVVYRRGLILESFIFMIWSTIFMKLLYSSGPALRIYHFMILWPFYEKEDFADRFMNSISWNDHSQVNVGVATTYMCTVAQSLVTTLYTASEARVIREPIFFNPEWYTIFYSYLHCSVLCQGNEKKVKYWVHFVYLPTHFQIMWNYQ